MTTTPIAPTLRNGLGVTALVLGIVSIVLSWIPVFGLILGTLALIFGAIGHQRARKAEADNPGMAITGIVLGAVTTVIGVGMIAAMVSAAHKMATEPPFIQPNASLSSDTNLGDRTYLIGTDMAPGTYRTAGARPGPVPMCLWQRLANTSGDLDAVNASDITQGPAVVTIKITDAAFKSTGCQDWQKIS